MLKPAKKKKKKLKTYQDQQKTSKKHGTFGGPGCFKYHSLPVTLLCQS